MTSVEPELPSLTAIAQGVRRAISHTSHEQLIRNLEGLAWQIDEHARAISDTILVDEARDLAAEMYRWAPDAAALRVRDRLLTLARALTAPADGPATRHDRGREVAERSIADGLRQIIGVYEAEDGETLFDIDDRSGGTWTRARAGDVARHLVPITALAATPPEPGGEVRSAAELDELPLGTVIRAGWSSVFWRGIEGWSGSRPGTERGQARAWLVERVGHELIRVIDRPAPADPVRTASATPELWWHPDHGVLMTVGVIDGIDYGWCLLERRDAWLDAVPDGAVRLVPAAHNGVSA